MEILLNVFERICLNLTVHFVKVQMMLTFIPGLRGKRKSNLCTSYYAKILVDTGGEIMHTSLHGAWTFQSVNPHICFMVSSSYSVERSENNYMDFCSDM